MSRPAVVLHIGLHKTATRFLQRALFRNLDTQQYIVNPEPLFQALRRAARSPGNEAVAEDARLAVANARAEAGDRTIVISDPSISGDMYSSHVDYNTNLALVHKLFPDAVILYFVRRPSDWLQSAYRQALVKGPGMPIERFLNFYDGRFHSRIARRVNGVRNVEALTLQFLAIYRAYADQFGPERVYLFRQEDMRKRPDDVYRRLTEALGLDELPSLSKRVSGNRAFSAFAISLFFGGIGSTVDRPDPATAGQPGQHSLRRLHGTMRRLRTLFIRHIFDRIIYHDWDLLAKNGMREILESHYADEYRRLTAVAEQVLAEGPGPQARALAEDPAERSTEN